MRWCCEVYAVLKSTLSAAGLSAGVGDEGGFAPDLKTNKEPLKYMSEAVEKAGYELGRDFRFAMDPAVSECFNKETGLYELKGEGRVLSSSELLHVILHRQQGRREEHTALRMYQIISKIPPRLHALQAQPELAVLSVIRVDRVISVHRLVHCQEMTRLKVQIDDLFAILRPQIF